MVQGLDKLNRRWAAIPERVKKEVEAAMEQAADAVVADMRKLAPRDSGSLAQSINWTWGDAPKGTLTIGKVSGKEYGALSLTIFAGGGDAFYARFQEFGTVNMTANPFFYPVWRVWRKRVRSRISRAVTKALKAA